MPCACCNGRMHSKEDFDPFISFWGLRERLPLDNYKKKFKHPMVSPDEVGRSSSQLLALPTECYQKCLQYLDIGTLTTMRRVSQFTRSTIDSLPQYRDLYEHAPQALRACLATGISKNIPLLRLHESLTTMECFYCKEEDPSLPSFGTYLSLFECRRACLFCLRNNPALLPVEFTKITSLILQRNSSLKRADGFRRVRTIFGEYGPDRTRVYKTTTLVRGPSVAVDSGATLSEKEQRVLFGKKESCDIHHHPLVTASEESDITPSVYYVSPEHSRQILLLYQTAVIFPYLSSGKQISDYGVMCRDCNLHMQFEEHRWKREQRVRRSHGQDPSASDRTREHINAVRRKACRMYTMSEDAKRDGDEIVERARKEREDVGEVIDEEKGQEEGPVVKRAFELSIQAHQLLHAKEVLPKQEENWRRKMEVPPAAPPRLTI